MEIIKALAKIVYCRPPIGGTSENAARSRGVDPEQEVIGLINFTLEDLTAKKGYFVTPMDEFFRRTFSRLEIPFSYAYAPLPRSTNPPITLIWAGGSLKLNAEKKEGDEEYSISYDRILAEDVRDYSFDGLDTGEIDLDSVLARIKGRPLGEKIKIKLGKLEMYLQVGHDPGIFNDSGCYIDTKVYVKVEIPGQKECEESTEERRISRNNAIELIETSEEMIDIYLAHH